MAGVKALITLAFTGSLGLMFLILACALPQFNNWAPFSVIVFHILLPVPSLMTRRAKDESSAKDLATFITAGIVVSAFAMPIVMSRAPQVSTQNLTTTVDVVPGNLNKTVDVVPANHDGMTTSTPSPVIVTPDYLISGTACFLVFLSNTIMFLTYYGFYKIFGDDDGFLYL